MSNKTFEKLIPLNLCHKVEYDGDMTIVSLDSNVRISIYRTDRTYYGVQVRTSKEGFEGYTLKSRRQAVDIATSYLTTPCAVLHVDKHLGRWQIKVTSEC